jgi:hypothetical protein
MFALQLDLKHETSRQPDVLKKSSKQEKPWDNNDEETKVS